MRVRGWRAAVLGGITISIGAPTFPGAPGADTAARSTPAPFLQNAALPSVLMGLGLIVILFAFYRMGRESVR